MKKSVFLLVCAMALCACATNSTNEKGINAVPTVVKNVISQANKTCTVDSDCVAVQKGCCMCAGYEAVNKVAAKKIESVWQQACSNVPCTREMCYVQITPKCVNNTCQGELIKPLGAN